RSGEREHVRHDRTGRGRGWPRRTGRRDAAARRYARRRIARGALRAQSRVASSRPHRRVAAGTPRLRSRAGQGDGGAAPSISRQPTEDRRRAEDQMRRWVLGAAILLATVSLRAQSNVTFENVAKAIGITFTPLNGAT